ncbi:hypothetical protein HF325_004454 [Metschnikowia pulcherrima]|uniref:Ferric reductase transmembrane component n=1 Tax=Metschnikowia pulcherrima TaxID=27326 RepID=A0A8H7GNB6_9ASCO|nr:hypothetical protein HF325_004454 [Metschnikowia pulcherrima]
MKFPLVLSLLAANALAFEWEKFSIYEEGYLQARSCSMALLNYATFCKAQGYQQYSCFCTNKSGMASMAGCLQTLKKNPNPAFDWFVNYCDTHNKSISEDYISEALEFLSLSGRNYTEVPVAGKNESYNTQIDYPIYVNQKMAKNYYRAYTNFLGNYNWGYWFSTALYAYWAFVFVVAAVSNWSVVLFPNLRHVCNGRISKMWRKYVTLPALIRKKRNDHQECLGILDFLVPTRLETIVLSGFFWLTFLFNALYISWFEEDPVFKIKYVALWRYVGDRTGIIGTMLLPLMILVGGRNNFLQWLTRWKFSTFVAYHRWIGRVVVALVVVHLVAYTAIFVYQKRWALLATREYIIYGIMATVCGGLICFQGLLYLRRRYYEIFLAIHIILSIGFIVGSWRHIELFPFMEWIFASIAVWAVDRIVRVMRMVWFGAPKATVTLLADDCLRIVVAKPKNWPPLPAATPGCISVPADRTCTIRVCVEGPYGESSSVKSHDNVCHVLALKYAAAKQKVKLIWVLRELLTVEWIWDELHALKNTKVQTTIYITQPEANADVLLERMAISDGSSTEEKDSVTKEGKGVLEMLQEYYPHVTFVYGRPLMETIVDEETEEAERSAAFIACGHPAMVDDMRYAVVQKIYRTEKRVDFFEQMQVWT